MSPKQGCWLLAFVFTLLAGAFLTFSAMPQPRQSGPGAPLEGAVNGIALILGFALLVIAGVSFFLRPRTPVPEILGSELTRDHILTVSEHTQIVFPASARLVGLCYLDPASLSIHVATKFILPESDREIFLQNSIVTVGFDRPPHYALGSRTSWWKRDRLQSRLDRVQHLASGVYVECSLGVEEGQTVVYVSWA